MRPTHHTTLLLTLVLSVAFSANAQQRGGRGGGRRAIESGPERTPAPATAPSTNPSDDKPAAKAEVKALSVTEHELTLDGKPLKYRATAGTMAMKDEAGKTKADVFFVAYEKLPAPRNPGDRPITFVFNGGPGAAAVWLHLGALGPKRVSLTEVGEVPPPPNQVVDNEYTWLDSTDLVFIDPVGTGFSRPAQGEDPRQFFGVEQDLRSVGDFIRLFTTRYNRWASPKFLAGESYGTTRAAGLSEYLLDQLGIAVNGIVFVSSVLDFQTISFAPANDLPYPLYLPSYAAIAHHHKKLSPELQKQDLDAVLKEVERWALDDYHSALAKGHALSSEDRSAVEQKLAAYTGLPIDVIRKADLRIEPDIFRNTLLLDQRKMLGRYDARITGFDPDPLSRYSEYDPSYSSYHAAYASAFNDYVRRELKYESDLPYEVLTGRVRPWDFGQGGNGGWLTVANRLRNAMVKNPHLSVLFASGYYDLATPFFGTDYTVNHLELPEAQRKSITQTYYHGGHMMYHSRPDLKKLDQDIAAFIERTLAKRGTREGLAGE
jgi:carboxypeptidase C (cathepsin A)